MKQIPSQATKFVAKMDHEVSEEVLIAKFVAKMEQEAEVACIGGLTIFIFITIVALWRLLC